MAICILTQPVGCVRGMVRAILQVRRPRGHLKYEGVRETILRRYRKQVTRFFDYLRAYDIPEPRTFLEFEHVTGEYVNHLYQELEPYGYAGDFLSGIRRFLPFARRYTETAGLYFRNWRRSISFRQAVPLPPNALFGIAGCLVGTGRLRLGAALLIGFAGLLRTTELLTLTKEQIVFTRNNRCAVLSLPDSKGAKRKNAAGHVMLSDPQIILLLRCALVELQPNESLCGCSARHLSQVLKSLGSFVGVNNERLTLYSLRRGGASWHFTTYQHLDATQALGRWEQQRTVRLYINAAVAELAASEIAGKGLKRAQIGLQVLVRACRLIGDRGPSDACQLLKNQAFSFCT